MLQNANLSPLQSVLVLGGEVQALVGVPRALHQSSHQRHHLVQRGWSQLVAPTFIR